MFISKIVVSTALAAGLLSSCSFIESHTSPETYNLLTLGDNGAKEASKATLAYSQGDFNKADEHVQMSLRQNPKNTQALMVGALTAEKTGRLNRARQYYEDLIIVGENETTILGSTDGTPQKMSDIAKKRLRRLNMQQSEFMIEDKDGTMTFNISKEAAARQGKSAMEEALFVRNQQLIASNQADADADIKAVEVLFDDNEKNVISRFLIMKELAEKDMITKQEFLAARQANIGGLLPLTNKAPAFGINAPVPSPDLIIERINSLKGAVEARAITPQEFSAERDLIIKAILPPEPRVRMKPKAPAKDILTAAKDLRKLEVISELGLVTQNEKAQEQKAIESALGLNIQPKTESALNKKITSAKAAPSKSSESPAPDVKADKPVQQTSTAENLVPAQPNNNAPENITEVEEEVQILEPEVSSPFK